MTDALYASNIELAAQHLGVMFRAARTYLDAPIQSIRDNAAMTVRVQARVLRTLSENSGDPNLAWAAGEADIVIAQILTPRRVLQ